MFASIGVSSSRVAAPTRVASGRRARTRARAAAVVVAGARLDGVSVTPPVSGSETFRDARVLLPSDASRLKSANLVATVSARPAPPPPPVPEVSPFTQFCRANWGFFAALQTVALIGASFNGRLARKRRLEIKEINGKLRAMMQKQESAARNAEFASEDEDELTSVKLGEGKKALLAKDWEAAVAAFDEARTAAKACGVRSAELSAYKGLARALIEAGQLKAVVSELVNAVDLAVEQSDGSVYGMLGDVHTDLAELGEAGRYYDLCLAMD